MSKTIHVKPVNKLRLELEDKTYECAFNMLCLANMQEELAKIDGTLSDLSPARMVSIILYSGIKACDVDGNFTYDEAVALAVNLDPSCYAEIMNMYFDSVVGSMDEESQNELKKIVAQTLSSVMK